jgi:hypothetical protein
MIYDLGAFLLVPKLHFGMPCVVKLSFSATSTPPPPSSRPSPRVWLRPYFLNARTPPRNGISLRSRRSRDPKGEIGVAALVSSAGKDGGKSFEYPPPSPRRLTQAPLQHRSPEKAKRQSRHRRMKHQTKPEKPIRATSAPAPNHIA